MNFLDEGEDISNLTINSSYAEKYAKIKKSEELTNLQSKYAQNPFEDSSSSSSEEEDEVGELVTPEVDAQIMKTIALLKSKTPDIYNPEIQFFDAQKLSEAENKWQQKQKAIKESGKPMRIKDFQRRQLLSQNNDNVESEITPVQEEELLKLQTRAAFAAAVDDDEPLLSIRDKSSQDKLIEEEEYKKFLLEHLDVENNSKTLNEWRSFKESKEVDPNESFLMEYILTRGWMDPDAEAIPEYKEIVDDSEDEAAVEAAEEFENKYNFRYEEEGAAAIVSHARNIEGTIRRSDDKRKRMREMKLSRKETEKMKKDEELKRLKNLKMEEIRSKLQTIKEIAGGNIIGLEEVDLEKDFDPQEYDQKMNDAFGDDYYKEEDASKKPVFDSDIDIGDILEEDVEHIQTKLTKRPLNEENPQIKATLEKYLEEYYQLDYEDIVADIPTRFKYRKVEKDDYGLKVSDILEADDKDLNTVVSLKKLAPFRQREKVERDKLKWKKQKKKGDEKENTNGSEDQSKIVRKGLVNISSDRLKSYGV